MPTPIVTEVKPDATVKAGEVVSLKDALKALGIQQDVLDKEVKQDVKRGDLARVLIEICRKAEKKKV